MTSFCPQMRRLDHGVKLGNPNDARALKGKQVRNKQAVAAIKANAAHRVANLRAILDDLRSQGSTERARRSDAARWHVAPNLSRAAAVAVASITPTETEPTGDTSAMSLLLPLVLPEMTRVRGFKNVD